MIPRLKLAAFSNTCSSFELAARGHAGGSFAVGGLSASNAFESTTESTQASTQTYKYRT